MEQVKSPEVEQPEAKAVDLIPEERLKELLNILLPYGYSYHDDQYTGVSPYIKDTYNIITIVANDPKGWGSVFAIVMERFTDEEDEANSLGFYKGIMKLIAPELHSDDDKFKDGSNVLDFNWASDRVQENRFPVKVEYQQL
jgi:hypothetical protein